MILLPAFVASMRSRNTSIMRVYSSFFRKAIFHARVDIGVVVDLDNVAVAAALLDVDAV